MKNNNDYETLKEAIEIATAKGDFPDAAKLILMGRISYAAMYRDISLNQVNELQSLLGKGFADQHVRDLEIAIFGDVIHEGPSPALAMIV